MSTERGRERTAAMLLGVYKRVISPMLHAGALSQCKFLPTCSEYAYVAIVGMAGCAADGSLCVGWRDVIPSAKAAWTPCRDAEYRRFSTVVR